MAQTFENWGIRFSLPLSAWPIRQSWERKSRCRGGSSEATQADYLEPLRLASPYLRQVSIAKVQGARRRSVPHATLFHRHFARWSGVYFEWRLMFGRIAFLMRRNARVIGPMLRCASSPFTGTLCLSLAQLFHLIELRSCLSYSSRLIQGLRDARPGVGAQLMGTGRAAHRAATIGLSPLHKCGHLL
jgi:hypothetical protein